MILEISFGAILGYVGKEIVEFMKAIYKEKQEKRRVYFDKKLELPISSMKILNAIVIQLHNCALSLKMIKAQQESDHPEGLTDATKIFIDEYKEIHKKAKEFPHEVTLFYDLPSFDTIFGQFNEMLQKVLQTRTIPLLIEGNSQQDMERLWEEINTNFTNLTGFIDKIDEKARLMEKCLGEIREQFRKYE
jgi:hypothetical protein